MVKSKTPVRDGALYVLIGLAIVGAVILLGLYDADHDLSSDAQIQWITAGVYTCLVFGFVIRLAPKAWRSRKGLALLLGMLVLHSSLTIWLVRYFLETNAARIPLMVYMFAFLGEIAAFSYVTARVLNPKHHPDR
jgi:peptidoglycan/LPS O-acetylase OafA/YrhL